MSPPRTRLEQTLADAWSWALGLEPISRDDVFADIGGTSLAAERVLARLRRELGLRIDADLLVGRPTLAELAARIEARRAEVFRRGGAHTVLADPADPQRPPLWCFAGAGSTAVAFLGVASRCGHDRAVHALHAHGFTARAMPSYTLAQHARRHLRTIRSVQPSGPYTFVGHSFGGHIAAAAAVQISRDAEGPARVLLLDTVLSAIHGRSVADYAGATQAPALAERVRTHGRVLTAGLVRYDAPTHQAAMWEQAVRAQNRIRSVRVPHSATVMISDLNAAQEPLWEGVDPRPRIVRIRGDHHAMLSDPLLLDTLAAEIDLLESR